MGGRFEMAVKNDRKIEVLSDRDHILIRPNTYLGSVVPTEKEEWVLSSEGFIKKSKLEYTDALLKVISEILDNCLDEYSRTKGKYSNKISVKIQNDKVTIEDNGRGLLVEQDKEGNWMPVTAFTKLRAGSNFSDDDRLTIGTNGIGSAATNVFSKKFEVNTCDGKKRMKITCKDNLSSTKFTFLESNLDKKGTKVEFTPDYKRFGVDSMPESICTLVKTRLRILSWFFPKCTFTFNGEKMGLKAKEFNSMLPSPNCFINTDNLYIAVYKTEEPEFLTYVNGISLRRGGNHLDFISSKVITDIREKLIKKYKNIKPNDIKNRLGFVILMKDFPNCQFDSQTKEYLSNGDKEVKQFIGELDLSKLSKKILSDKEMVDNITDMFRLKEELAEKKALQKLNVKKKDIDSDKYFPPVGDRKYLMLTEGYSAFSGLSAVLGRKGNAFYALRGKPLNVSEITNKKMLENKEISDIVNVLGIDLTGEDKSITFEKVVFATDQDVDGTHIRSLLTTFFSRVSPHLFDEKRICILNTPLVIGLKNNKVEKYFYTLNDFSAYQAKYPKSTLKWKYIKGLGGWNKSELDQVIALEGGLENLMVTLEKDKDADNTISDWMGSNSDIRKEKLKGREFHIDKI